MQTWAHPKFGDRLDVGLVRQIEDGIEALKVWPPLLACLASPPTPALHCQGLGCKSLSFFILNTVPGILVFLRGAHHGGGVTGLHRNNKARSLSCQDSLGGKR